MEIEQHKKTETADGAPCSAAWKRWVAAGMVGAVGLTAVGVAVAQSRDFGSGMMMGGGHGMMHGPMAGGDFLERRLGYVLEAIKATPEQSAKIKEIMTGAREDMSKTRNDFLDTRDRFAEVLGAATIDRDAVEKLRADRFQIMDEASKKHLGALLDAAEVLTPEQRAQLLQHFKERRAFRRW